MLELGIEGLHISAKDESLAVRFLEQLTKKIDARFPFNRYIGSVDFNEAGRMKNRLAERTFGVNLKPGDNTFSAKEILTARGDAGNRRCIVTDTAARLLEPRLYMGIGGGK